MLKAFAGVMVWLIPHWLTIFVSFCVGIFAYQVGKTGLKVSPELQAPYWIPAAFAGVQSIRAAIATAIDDEASMWAFLRFLAAKFMLAYLALGLGALFAFTYFAINGRPL